MPHKRCAYIINYKGGGGTYGFNMGEKAMSFWREDAICAVIPSRI